MNTIAPEAMDRLAREDVPCLTCGYNLRGLVADGACPECGSAIARSLQGNLLQYSAPDYVQRLHSGVVLILLANLVAIVLWVGKLLIPFALLAINQEQGSDLIEDILTFLDAPIDLAALLGWWMFSSPDPAIVGSDTGDQPRRFVRIAVVIALVVTLLQAIEAAGGLPIGNVMQFIDGPLMLLAVAAGVMKFIAAMLYLRWLAPRIPSKTIEHRANLYMWLLPVILVVGCFIFPITYILVLVLYLVLLDYVRRSIKAVRARMSEGPLPDAAS